MKIILANYRYFVSGGPERYMFNLTDALEARGHEVISFSIHYEKNWPSPYSKYFVEPLGTRDEVFFKQQQLKIRTLWRTFSRLFYASEVERAVLRLAKDTQPQIAYVLHYLRKLSPSLLVGLKKAGIPIVVRLSDYAMVCPQALCLNHGELCEQCFQGNLWPSVRYGCVQNSRIVSFINLVATWYHRYHRFFDLIDLFVTTNQFMHECMLKAGYPEKRLVCIPTFVNGNNFQPSLEKANDNLIVYSGRIEHSKGIEVLIEALGVLKRKHSYLNFILKIAGTGDDVYVNELHRRVRKLDLVDHIQFVGLLDIKELSGLLRGAIFSVVPSLWYENLPNTILESFSSGTPVIASNIGSLSACVDVGETGYLFETGNAVHLAERLNHCLNHLDEMAVMGLKAHKKAEEVYSVDTHLTELENVFSKLIEQ
jgi:glycosyltransferase involved in cell wall biosynthesis